MPRRYIYRKAHKNKSYIEVLQTRILSLLPMYFEARVEHDWSWSLQKFSKRSVRRTIRKVLGSLRLINNNRRWSFIFERKSRGRRIVEFQHGFTCFNSFFPLVSKRIPVALSWHVAYHRHHRRPLSVRGASVGEITAQRENTYVYLAHRYTCI